MSVRRVLKLPGITLSMGRNPRTFKPGHWYDKRGGRNAACHCGSWTIPHPGIYEDDFYGSADAGIGFWKLFILRVWVNNRGACGAYYAIGSAPLRRFWLKRGRRNRYGIDIGLFGRSGWDSYGDNDPRNNKLLGPSLNWSDL